jgi:ABC-type phosphate transport system substrate-binding protein
MKKLVSSSIFAFAALILAAGASAQVIVIANPSVKSSAIGKDELRDVFTGSASTLKDGSKVVPVLLKEGTPHEEFLKEFIGKADTAYRAAWRSLVFSGQATMPRSLDGDAAVAAFVAHNTGAIGYIDKATPHEGVKVLEVH